MCAQTLACTSTLYTKHLVNRNIPVLTVGYRCDNGDSLQEFAWSAAAGHTLSPHCRVSDFLQNRCASQVLTAPADGGCHRAPISLAQLDRQLPAERKLFKTEGLDCKFCAKKG